MGNIYHANAKTTIRIRKEIQESEKTIAELAAYYKLNLKTIVRWKKAVSFEDKKSGPSNPHSTSLTLTQEQIICEFRKKTRFALDNVLVCLKDPIPELTRSNLYRCLKRHGLNVLPKEEEKAKPKRKKFKEYKIGYVHVDITEVKL